MVKGRICPECLRDLDQEYIEEGDHRFSINPIKCPHCGWELWNEWESEAFQHLPSVVKNDAGLGKKCKRGVSSVDNQVKDWIQALIRTAGDTLLKHFRQDWSLLNLRSGAKEAVTKYDKEIDRLIINQIKGRYPNHSLLTEESGFLQGDPDWLWIVDSLDGTGNFANFNPLFSICIALLHKGQLLIGAIYAPAIDEFYFAEKDKGAYLNGHKIQVTNVSDLSQSYVFYCEGGERDRNRTGRLVRRIYPQVMDLRKLGSAGLETAWVAAGRGEAYLTTTIEPWNVAAGVLLVQEAGGKITDFEGNPWKPERMDLLFSNGKVHDKILKLVLH